MRRRRAHHVGRVRWRLAELIAAQGYEVSGEDLVPSQGYWRIGKYEEGPAWTGHAVRLSDGQRVSFSAHAPMTECLSEGFTISEGDGPGHYWVDPKAWCKVCGRECHCPWSDTDEHHCRMLPKRQCPRVPVAAV